MTYVMRKLARDHGNITGDDYSYVVKELARRTMRGWAEKARPVEQHAGCRIPDCQCDGRIEIMEWGPEDMTETDDSDYEDSSVFDRPVTESVTAWAGSDTDLPSDEHSEFFDRPVTDSVTAQIGSYTDFPNGEHSEFVDRRVTESVTAQAESDTSFPSGEDSEFFDRPVTESVTARAADTVQILVIHVSTVTTEQSELSDTDVPSGEDSEFID